MGWRRTLGLVAVAGGMAMSTIGCGAHGQKQPVGHVEVKHLDTPDDAPENAKTVQVSYVFDRDIVNKDYEKSFTDGFDKKGVHVDEQLNTRAHFDIKNAKITGTVTYYRGKFGGFHIVEADLVAEGSYAADVQVDLDVKVKAETQPKPQPAQPANGKKKKGGMFAAFSGKQDKEKEGLIPAEAKLEDSDFDGTALGGKPFPIVKNVMPTNIPIAGPLFLHAHFDLTAACDLGIEGAMHATTGVGIKGDVRLAAKYKKAGIEKPDGKKSKFAFEAKAPNFELAPRPYLKVEGKQQSIKGRCSIQPTAVLLLEKSVGAKLMVEPWVELDASRPTARSPWKLAAGAGVSVNAATDIEFFGRPIRKPKEFQLYDVALMKAGEDLNTTPPPPVPATTPTRASDVPATAIASIAPSAAPSTPTPAAPASETTPTASTPATPAPVASASKPSSSETATNAADIMASVAKEEAAAPTKTADASEGSSSSKKDSKDESSSDESSSTVGPAPTKKLAAKGLKNVNRKPSLGGAASKLMKRKR